jgi:hypothetical protein
MKNIHMHPDALADLDPDMSLDMNCAPWTGGDIVAAIFCVVVSLICAGYLAEKLGIV